MSFFVRDWCRGGGPGTRKPGRSSPRRAASSTLGDPTARASPLVADIYRDYPDLVRAVAEVRAGLPVTKSVAWNNECKWCGDNFPNRGANTPETCSPSCSTAYRKRKKPSRD